MTRFANTLTQIAFVAAATLSSLVMLQASTASAQTPGPSSNSSASYFSAELAAPVEKTTKIIQGVVWQCEGTVCSGSKATSRPINACTRLSRKMGEVTSFSTRSEPMAGEDLTACNAKG
ncbi:CC_3452 family protein [Blastomonas sp.]|uniref:CC_3452 family protein n=1 Tax=Blastomonas sp. TaxID=1909299 RepID=UPI00391CA557